MQDLKDFDTTIFQAASAIVASGEQHRPLVILMMTDGSTQIIDCTHAFSDESGKDAVARLIDMLSKRDEVSCVAFVSEAWMVVEPKLRGGRFPRPSTHPERVECVVVSFSLANGKRAISLHTIRRPAKKAPFLVRGDLSVEEGEVKFDGRFFAERRGTIH